MASEACASDVCSSCLGTLADRDTRVLPCLHPICRRCVDDMLVTASDGSIQCPICRSVCPIPTNGGSGLPRFVPLRASHVFSGRCPLCELAGTTTDDAAQLSAWCETCRVGLCSAHAMEHIMTSDRNHLVGPWRDGVDTHAQGKPSSSTDELFACHVHKQPLRFHCGACNEAICGDCASLGAHQGHKQIRYIQEVVDERKQGVSRLVEHLDEKRSQ